MPARKTKTAPAADTQMALDVVAETVSNARSEADALETFLYPIECSDEYGLEGVPNGEGLAQWLNNWLRDDDSSRCVIEKVTYTDSIPLDPEVYLLKKQDQ